MAAVVTQFLVCVLFLTVVDAANTIKRQSSPQMEKIEAYAKALGSPNGYETEDHEKFCCRNVSDCHCFVDTCYDIGYQYCKHPEATCGQNCHPDHCCCCDPEYPMDKCPECKCPPEERCACVGEDKCCEDLGLEYCRPTDCQQQGFEQCEGRRCCCKPHRECPRWGHCYCMEQPCSAEEGMEECGADPSGPYHHCGDDCPRGHCCCCPEDYLKCDDSLLDCGGAADCVVECQCQHEPCHAHPELHFCDPDKCRSPDKDSALECPPDHCCCKH